ncbi:thiosulfate sulfurtransferase GlpE [Vibrio hannami]|uniref:thiosulfate sulfurtransferase GlpE n=1 Tax=Vibrio hannami TaxID=2717094 RepID=UPI00240FD1D2|nr:thiosulfate sulfurtransferase GlpE [Vibrio hannami]MDG3086661.1 thiosulfate sulfurtransferase GlpE [Vibrio hannami]
MSSFKNIDVLSAYKLQQEKQAVLVDIRDPGSYTIASPQGSYHLTNDTMVEFMNHVEFETPVLVICYHGVSSQGAAQYLINQGFEEVYSVDGGFEAWKREGLPVEKSE